MQYGGEREADHAAALRARREDSRPRQHPHKAGARTCSTGHDTAAILRAARAHRKARTAQCDCILNIAHRKVTLFRRPSSNRTHVRAGRHSLALARALNILPDIET